MATEFDVNQEAATAFDLFPEAAEKVFIVAYDDTSYAPAHQVEAKDPQISRWLESHRDELATTIAQLSGSSMGIYMSDDRKRVFKGVYVKTNKHADERNYAPADPAADTAYVFDHELGHAIVKDADRPSGHTAEDRAQGVIVCESIADSFAVLRGFQRHGMEKGREYAQNLLVSRSLNLLVGNDVNHMTAAVIDKIIEDSKTIDFSALTPKQLVTAARHYGRREHSSLKDVLAVANSKYTERKDMDLSASTALAVAGQFSFKAGHAVFCPMLATIYTQKDGFGWSQRDELKSRFTTYFQDAKTSSTATPSTATAERQARLLRELREEKATILTPVRQALKAISRFGRKLAGQQVKKPVISTGPKV